MSSPTIALITAAPRRLNPGMTAVALAFETVRRRCGLGSVDHYRYADTSIDVDDATGYDYRELFGHVDEVLDHDHVVFWGDFLQMASYHRDLAARTLASGWHSSHRDALDAVRRHLLLADVDASRLSRVVGYGGTLLFNSVHDRDDSGYWGALGRLVRESRLWSVRDPLSASQVHLLRDAGTGTYGVDAALHLDPFAVVANGHRSSNSNGRPRIGVFLGRTPIDQLVRKLKFAMRLARELDGDATWIPWFAWSGLDARRMRTRPDVRRTARRLGDRRQPETDAFPQLLTMVRDCEVVITDTYHLAVMGWSMGVPTVCLGGFVTERPLDASSGQRGEWSDKRFVFFAQHLLSAFYVHNEELASASTRRYRVEQLRELLHDPPIIERLHTDMCAMATNAEDALSGLFQLVT